MKKILSIFTLLLLLMVSCTSTVEQKDEKLNNDSISISDSLDSNDSIDLVQPLDSLRIIK